jgi:hypothetical protein
LRTSEGILLSRYASLAEHAPDELRVNNLERSGLISRRDEG